MFQLDWLKSLSPVQLSQQEGLPVEAGRSPVSARVWTRCPSLPDGPLSVISLRTRREAEHDNPQEPQDQVSRLELPGFRVDCRHIGATAH